MVGLLARAVEGHHIISTPNLNRLEKEEGHHQRACTWANNDKKKATCMIDVNIDKKGRRHVSLRLSILSLE